MSSGESIKYLLIGGGVTSANAASKIREIDDAGSITILGLEPHLPYDRPPLTKEYLQDDGKRIDDILCHDGDFYAKNRIAVIKGKRATKLDPISRTVSCEDGSHLKYEKLLLATGASPRAMEVPGKDLDGIKVLRWVDESYAIRAALRTAKRVVLVGAGYIGMEVAASILKRREHAHISIVDPNTRPWSRFASPKLGGFLQEYFTAQGVEFHLGPTVTGFIGDNQVHAVRMDNGEEIPADLVIVGIGVILETSLAKAAGLDVNDKEGVVVDKFLKSSEPNIWAAGDIAYFDDVAMGEKWHLEHYMNAMWQGEAVGRNMAGEATAYDQVPYFFSDMGDLHMVLRGNVRDPGETRVLGDATKRRFVELYPNKEGVVRMIVAVSENQAELEARADRYEPIIRGRRPIGDIDEADVGI